MHGVAWRANRVRAVIAIFTALAACCSRATARSLRQGERPRSQCAPGGTLSFGSHAPGSAAAPALPPPRLPPLPPQPLAALCSADNVTLQASNSTPSQPWLDAPLPMEQRLDALLGALTPQQKAAQLQTDAGGAVPELGLQAFTWQVSGEGNGPLRRQRAVRL